MAQRRALLLSLIRQAALDTLHTAVSSLGQAERARLQTATHEAEELHTVVQAAAGATPAAPRFTGDEREILGSRALRLGDAPGVAAYTRAGFAEAQRLDFLVARLPKMTQWMGANPQAVPLDQHTAKALNDLLQQPVTPEQIRRGAAATDTNFVAAEMHLMDNPQTSRQLWDALEVQRSLATPGAAMSVAQVQGRLAGQRIVAETLTGGVQAGYQRRFAPDPQMQSPPRITGETLEIEVWTTPDAPLVAVRPQEMAELAAGGTPLMEVPRLARFSGYQATPLAVESQAVLARIEDLQELALAQRQGYLETQEVLAQLSAEYGVPAATRPVASAVKWVTPSPPARG